MSTTNPPSTTFPYSIHHPTDKSAALRDTPQSRAQDPILTGKFYCASSQSPVSAGRPMSSTLDAEPVSFFSLSQELRDQIVSTNPVIHSVDKRVLLTDTLRLEQYDLLHQDQEVADFGATKELDIRYPLPRLHQISRRFTAECDLRAPAQPLVVISQTRGAFNPSKTLIGCPKILRLRHMQPFLSQQLQFDFHIVTTDDCTASVDVFKTAVTGLGESLKWVRHLARTNRSNVNVDNVRVRVMFSHTSALALALTFVTSKCH